VVSDDLDKQQLRTIIIQIEMKFKSRTGFMNHSAVEFDSNLKKIFYCSHEIFACAKPLTTNIITTRANLNFSCFMPINLFTTLTLIQYIYFVDGNCWRKNQFGEILFYFSPSKPLRSFNFFLILAFQEIHELFSVVSSRKHRKNSRSERLMQNEVH
jgi:hypothetical protein